MHRAHWVPHDERAGRALRNPPTLHPEVSHLFPPRCLPRGFISLGPHLGPNGLSVPSRPSSRPTKDDWPGRVSRQPPATTNTAEIGSLASALESHQRDTKNRAGTQQPSLTHAQKETTGVRSAPRTRRAFLLPLGGAGVERLNCVLRAHALPQVLALLHPPNTRLSFAALKGRPGLSKAHARDRPFLLHPFTLRLRSPPLSARPPRF